jgi:uncharacterized repeat protein (TIGR01451 family)
VPPPDLFVVKTASAGTVRVGDKITFYIGYGNTGGSDAAGVRLSDSVRGGCFTSSGFTDTIGTLGAGASGTKTVSFTASKAGTCTTTVTLSASNAASASDSVTITVNP